MVAHAVKSERLQPNAIAGKVAAPARADHRPAMVRQARLTEIAATSPQAMQLARWQALADGARRPVAQLSPDGWKEDARVTQILGHAHGWFSTWKQIKANIRAYRQLRMDYLPQRRDALAEIKRLIVEWEINDKHTPASTEARVQGILADLPMLKQLIAEEEVEVDDDANLLAFPNVDMNIPAELTDGIAALPGNAAKAARLFQNVNNFRFRYTGMFISYDMAYTAHQGDCQTLAGMYQQAALAMGIPFALGSDRRRQLVAPAPIHGRSTTANTDGNTDWYFQDHYWAIGNGTAYDLLFMVSPPPVAIYSNGSDNYRNITYYTFTDGRCVIEAGQDRLRNPFAGQAKVFQDVHQMRTYIDARL